MSLIFKIFCNTYPPANLLTLNSSKTEFLLIGLQQQLAEIHNCSLSSLPLIQLGILVSSSIVISLSLTKYHLSKSCYYHIHELRCIRRYLYFKTASTIATSIVHSKLDYCNSLYYNLPKSEINRLQVIQNSLARAVVISHLLTTLALRHTLTISFQAQNSLPRMFSTIFC